MNDYDAFPKRVRGGKWHAMVRTASDAEARPVLGDAGLPKQFENEAAALAEATHHLLRYINGRYVRAGEVAGETAAAADAVFKPFVRQKGKSRVITVAYKKGRASAR